MCKAQIRTQAYATGYCGKFPQMMVVKFADDYIGVTLGLYWGSARRRGNKLETTIEG